MISFSTDFPAFAGVHFEILPGGIGGGGRMAEVHRAFVGSGQGVGLGTRLGSAAAIIYSCTVQLKSTPLFTVFTSVIYVKYSVHFAHFTKAGKQQEYRQKCLSKIE